MERDRRDPEKEKDDSEIVRSPQRGGPQQDPNAEIVRQPSSQSKTPSPGSQQGGGRMAGSETDSGRTEGSKGGGSGAVGSMTGSGLTLPQWSRRTWMNILGVALVAVMGYLFIFGGPGAGPKTDAPSQQHDQEMAKHPGLPTVSLSAADLDKKMTQLALDAANAGQPIPGLPNLPPNVIRDIRKGEVSFYSLLVFDDHDEDGDVVKISLGNGMEYGPFTLTNKGLTISIPVKAGVPPNITLHAIKDGYPSYGVTCGIKTSDGFWYSSILPESATQQVSLMAR